MSFKEWLWKELTDEEEGSIDTDYVDYDEFDQQYLLDYTKYDEQHIEEFKKQYENYCSDRGTKPVWDFE